MVRTKNSIILIVLSVGCDFEITSEDGKNSEACFTVEFIKPKALNIGHGIGLKTAIANIDIVLRTNNFEEATTAGLKYRQPKLFEGDADFFDVSPILAISRTFSVKNNYSKMELSHTILQLYFKVILLRAFFIYLIIFAKACAFEN